MWDCFIINFMVLWRPDECSRSLWYQWRREMPPPEKFPKPKRLHQKYRMENVVRSRPDYRRLANLPKPEDIAARRQQKDAKEATERSREHGSKHGEKQRISLPAKPARVSLLRLGSRRIRLILWSILSYHRSISAWKYLWQYAYLGSCWKIKER